MRKGKVMSERFTRWGRKKPEEERQCVEPISLDVALATTKPSTPGLLQMRRFSNALERRTAAESSNSSRIITGCAIPYGVKLQFDGGIRELFCPGCFAQSLRDDDARCLLNSDPERVLGRVSSGTLDLWEKREGLFFLVHAPQTGYSDDLLTLIARGDITDASAVFWILAHRNEQDAAGSYRAIDRARLLAVGPASFGLMDGAYVDVEAKLMAAHAAGVAEGRRQAALEAGNQRPARAGSAARLKQARSQLIDRTKGRIQHV